MAIEKSHPVSQSSLESASAKKTLSDDQKQALAHVTGPERITVVQGVAGAGKSYMLDAARDAWERDGYTVIGAALAGKAAEGLRESSGIESTTIHRMTGLLDAGQIELNAKTVIVLDEAGMIGSRLFDRLQQHADAAGAKLVLVGDTQQLQPIDAGGAMRAVQERAGAVLMDDIRRQKDPEQRQIVRDFKEGRADAAIDRLEKLGLAKTYETAADARSGMASAIVKDMGEGKTSIGLAGTRAEVHQINQQARAEAQQAGLVDEKGHKFETERGARQFSDGDRVIFLKNDNELGVRNGTTGTVERAAEGNLVVKLDSDAGRRVELGDQSYRHIDHGYAMTVHKSQSVTVDRAHLIPGRMTDQHSAYVGASRHRETVQIHGTAEQIKDMRHTASREHTKDTGADARYTPIERPQDRTPVEQRQAQPTEIQIEKLEQARAAFDERAAESRQALETERGGRDEPQSRDTQNRGDERNISDGNEAASASQQPDPAREADPRQPQPIQLEATAGADGQPPEQQQAGRDEPQARDAAARGDERNTLEPGQRPEPEQTGGRPPDAAREVVQQQLQPRPEQIDRRQAAPAHGGRTEAAPDRHGEAQPGPRQVERVQQLKHETERHQQRQPERQGEQRHQLKHEAERHQQRQPERQGEQTKTPSREPERDRQPER
jgi:hypothetical protein